jgi:hypothetical protein
MCRFCSAHDHHLYRVLGTGLYDHILQCLEVSRSAINAYGQIDTSNGIVTMSLTVLVMLLPNVCNRISKRLPELFFILYRIICWQKGERIDEEPSSFTEPTWPLGHRRESWDAAGIEEITRR